MNNDLKLILNYLNEQRSFDFSGYRTALIESRVKQQFASTKCSNYNDYLQYLKASRDELDNLINVLTINVSRFFRDTLMFEYFADKVLPAVIYQKKQAGDRSLRIWSAGCAMGEEPYSIAILIKEFLKKDVLDIDVTLFATDIDDKILKKAKKAS
jgi:chemotaxis protein methyltransferase CheR